LPAVTAFGAVDFVVFLLIITPVFVVQVKLPDNFCPPSKRQEADLQLRRLISDIIPDTKIPVLHGVSVFGTKIAFYHFDRESRRLQPETIAPDLDVVIETVPKEWWHCEILQQEGADKFREVVSEVKKMSRSKIRRQSGV
jgi:hypothetical protein